MYNKRKVLHDIRTQLEAGSTLGVACKNAGLRSRTTLDNWRKRDSRIDVLIKKCMYRSDEKRTDIVEDAFFKRLASGQGSPTDYIFYLTNRRPERWKHQNAMVNVGVNVENGNRIQTPHAVIFSAVKDECKTSRL